MNNNEIAGEKAPIIEPPWSKEIVDKLNKYQHWNGVHHYTCGFCRDNYGTYLVKNETDKLIRAPRDWINWNSERKDKEIIFNERILIATENGWICETCDNVQDWCLQDTIKCVD